jgi:hypothetical protein
MLTPHWFDARKLLNAPCLVARRNVLHLHLSRGAYLRVLTVGRNTSDLVRHATRVDRRPKRSISAWPGDGDSGVTLAQLIQNRQFGLRKRWGEILAKFLNFSGVRMALSLL